MSILEIVLESRGGSYVHAVEVGNKYDLQIVAEEIFEEFQESHTVSEIIDFLETLEVYYLPIDIEDYDKEEEVYNFSFTDYINNNYIL